MKNKAFTLIELLTVIAIIAILMSLILSVGGYVQENAARNRAKSEIAAMETAMESYKADNGIYPEYNNYTDVEVDVPNEIANAYFSSQLCGNASGYTDQKVYFDMGGSRKMLSEKTKEILLLNPDSTGEDDKYKKYKILMLKDPFGSIYGYSTKKVMNPTFDLWSVANTKWSNNNEKKIVMKKWVTNWQ